MSFCVKKEEKRAYKIKVLKNIILVILSLLFFLGTLSAKEISWKELNSKVVQLYQQRRYTEGIKIAKEALRVAKERFGPGHPNVAQSLNNLGLLYHARQIE